MRVGATLAHARRQAGLTIAEVSQRTLIREAIVSGIERDDYSRCGGDFYARGHIRAIAHAVGADPGPLIEEYDAARNEVPGLPAETVRMSDVARTTSPVMHEPSRGSRVVLLGLALVVVVGAGGYLLFARGGSPPRASSTATSQRASGSAPATSAPRSSASRVTPTPAPDRSASPVREAPPRVLHPVSIAAFGPGGTGQGDSPQLASLALGGNPATPWHSDWYTTPHFGNLQSGTGLLLDMGRPVTVVAARVSLGGMHGANFELRVGSTPALSALRPVAYATDAGGVVRLRATRAARGRYVLIWFTRLPPDPAGTFQADVYGIGVRGHP